MVVFYQQRHRFRGSRRQTELNKAPLESNAMIQPPQTNFIPNSHCGFCGSKFAEQITWPRRCFRCGNDSWKNPIPVVVALIEVGSPYDSGILIEQRGISPKKGEWALPSGFVDLGETWDQAAAREVKEELGLDSEPAHYDLLDIQNDTTGHMLIFCKLLVYYTVEDLSKFVPNEEVLAVDVIKKPRELAFPTHTSLVSTYFGL
jgi:ADP-ribose pyrophosphatase YjhB (NUDIX family)